MSQWPPWGMLGLSNEEEDSVSETLTIVDDRTGETIAVPIEDGTIRATALKPLGLMSYDPAFLNTASVRSAIT